MSPKRIFLLVIAIVILGLIATRFLPQHAARIESIDSTTTSTAPINPDLPPQAAAVLQMRTGTVVLVRNGERYLAHPEMELKPGDRLEVGESDALIIWPHYGRTIVESGSVIQIAKAFESTNRERFEVKFSLEKGRIWTKFFDSLFQGQTFQVRSGAVLIDSAGGSFGVTRRETGEVVVDVRTLAVQTVTVRDEVPTGEMRMAGFNEMYAEVATSQMKEVGGRAVVIAQDGSRTDAPPSTDAFAERGDAPILREELDVEPVDVTLLPESSL